MSPIWWLSLMVLFLILLYFVFSIIYFTKNLKFNSKFKFKNNQMIWQW
uniref:ATP synthase F0 subunit 8 n=1 Tax=Cicadella viridis TaxID=36150 RepID=A0A343X9P2_CICVR|nr:ATP synthase F0 subunit 8 [Cicadella viridis]